jgi:hypothetical protein
MKYDHLGRLVPAEPDDTEPPPADHRVRDTEPPPPPPGEYRAILMPVSSTSVPAGLVSLQADGCLRFTSYGEHFDSGYLSSAQAVELAEHILAQASEMVQVSVRNIK